MLEHLMLTVQSEGHVFIRESIPSGSGRVVVMAPHPDDPECSAVFQKMLLDAGWDIQWVILTSAWSGVRDEFVGPDKNEKARVRREEQADSARLFGLGESALTFANLPETDDGELEDNPDSYSTFTWLLDDARPDIVIAPWGQDTNATHRLVYLWLKKWLADCLRPVAVFLSEDPKSVDFAPNLYVPFDEDSATWKAALLECHRSQTERNLASRGCTFSERLIAVNRLNSGGYAERYRVIGGGPARGEDITLDCTPQV